MEELNKMLKRQYLEWRNRMRYLAWHLRWR